MRRNGWIIMGVKEKSIRTVYNFLNDSNLAIPKYQRPYKWTKEHVKQLFDDIQAFKNKSAYRLGTIVLHWDGKKKEKNIVDGQQRIVTLLMIIHALRNKEGINEKLKTQLEDLKKLEEKLTFSSYISKKNIYDNYKVIKKRVKNFNTEHINFLLNKCEFATFTLDDVSEAFQFFDSQNARGKDLEPYDLLKAYHLYAFRTNKQDEDRQVELVNTWEDAISKNKLGELFNYLHCIRQWANGQSARYFIKEDISVFKGISEENWIQELFAKEFDLSARQGKIDLEEQKIDIHVLPFRITQRIIDGRRFFEMIAHYQKMEEDYISENYDGHFLMSNLVRYAPEILKVINTYEGRMRKGDQFVRMIFDYLLLYYIDTFEHFEHKEISAAIEKIFYMGIQPSFE